MPLIGAFDKQPREQLPVDIAYSEVIAGRKVSSIVPTVEVPAGMTKVSQQVGGETLQICVSGGTSGHGYRWVVLTDITISGNPTRVEDEFDVVVLEVRAMTEPIVMTAAGQTATPIVRRAGEDRICQVDCRALLRQHELLVRMATEPVASLGMRGQARPARGALTLDVRLWGGELPEGRQKADGTVRLAVVTTQGVIELALAVRLQA